MEMAPTALVTFLFDCPKAARTVELFGSWDNFTKPYHLKQDKRKGAHSWSGCYTFENIICDGDLTNLCEKRDGALRMGGTYWYYYKVDDDFEYHNPAQPSTNVCPLLPGQRLNVLDVPIESRSRSCSGSSQDSEVFTRNPLDKFRTPVPPTSIPPPRVGDISSSSGHMHGKATLPRSVTYPPLRSISPALSLPTRSVASSPDSSPTSSLGDFRSLKGKFMKGSGKQTKNVRNLEIGRPILVSSTAADVDAPPSQSPPETSSSLPPRLGLKLREFSPLNSHPVDMRSDLDLTSSNSCDSQEPASNRPRSYSGATSHNELSHFEAPKRANSSTIRRSREFSMSKLNMESIGSTGSSQEERPVTRHGGSAASSIRKFPSVDKDLPELPRYLVPAPLFACGQSTIATESAEKQEEEEEEVEAIHYFPDAHFGNTISRFSAWTIESSTFDAPEDDAIHSPTFSSFTTSSTGIDTPQRFSCAFVHGDQICDEDQNAGADEEDEKESYSLHSSSGSHHLHLDSPSLNPLFHLDIHRPDTAPRRQAAVFGISKELRHLTLSDERIGSDSSTIRELTCLPDSPIDSNTVTSASQLDSLMNEFGYLGQAVL